jgi:hydrogenase-4 component B
MCDLFASSATFFLALLLWMAGAFASLVFRNDDRMANWCGNFFAILGAIAGLAFSLSALISVSTFSVSIATSLPLLSLSFKVDALSAFFIFVISLIALLASIYALGYVKHYYKKYNIGALGFYYNIFLAGMVLVVSASNALFFLIVWEIMSLASYFLVIFEHRERENVKAGSLYFIMTHVGTAFIILAFLLLYRETGSLDFSVIKENIGAVAPLVRNIIFILALVGFGTKAGVIPFHIWLPSAHPAAPSHVSALMSGVIIKNRHLYADQDMHGHDAGRTALVGGRYLGLGRHFFASGRLIRSHRTRYQKTFGLSQHRKYRDHCPGAGTWAYGAYLSPGYNCLYWLCGSAAAHL